MLWLRHTNPHPPILTFLAGKDRIIDNEATRKLVYPPLQILRFIHATYPESPMRKGTMELTGKPGGVALKAPRWMMRAGDLIGMEFSGFEDLTSFLARCDGVAPADWVPPGIPQSAAWCAVDLALLDAFGKHFGRAPFGPPAPELPAGFRYSGVLNSSRSWKQTAQLFAYRLLGCRALKLKVDDQSGPAETARISRLVGKRIDLRADVDMGWIVSQAPAKMPALAREGVGSIEHPRRVNVLLPRDICAVCLKALHKNPAARYPNARDMAADIRSHLEGRPVSAIRPNLVERIRHSLLAQSLTAT